MTLFAEPEVTHKRLFKAHWKLVEANNELHAAIVELTAAGRYSSEREKLKEPVAALARARDLVDGALDAASSGRSSLIHATGCDGSCNDG